MSDELNNKEKAAEEEINKGFKKIGLYLLLGAIVSIGSTVFGVYWHFFRN